MAGRIKGKLALLLAVILSIGMLPVTTTKCVEADTGNSAGLFEDDGTTLKSGGNLFIYKDGTDVKFTVTDNIFLNDEDKVNGVTITQENPLSYNGELNKNVMIACDGDEYLDIYLGSLVLADNRDFEVTNSRINIYGDMLKADNINAYENSSVSLHCDIECNTMNGHEQCRFNAYQLVEADSVAAYQFNMYNNCSLNCKNMNLTATDSASEIQSGNLTVTGNLTYNSIEFEDDTDSGNAVWNVNIMSGASSSKLSINGGQLNVNHLECNQMNNNNGHVSILGWMKNNGDYTSTGSSSKLLIEKNAYFYQNASIEDVSGNKNKIVNKGFMYLNNEVSMSGTGDVFENDGIIINKGGTDFTVSKVITNEAAMVVCSDSQNLTLGGSSIAMAGTLGRQAAKTVRTTGLNLEGGTDVSEDDYTWDDDERLLTLKGLCFISDTLQDMLILPEGAKVVLKEDTTSLILNNRFSNQYISVISGKGNYEINGNGTLIAAVPGDGAVSGTVATTSRCVAYGLKNAGNSSNNITIGNTGCPNIKVIAQDAGIYSHDKVAISNGSMDIWGGICGVDAMSVIQKNGTLTASAGKNVAGRDAYAGSPLLCGSAISVSGGGRLTLEGGVLNAEAFGYNGRGILTGNSYIEVLGGSASIQANGENGIGIDTNCLDASGCALTIKNNATMDLTGQNAAIIVQGYDGADTNLWLNCDGTNAEGSTIRTNVLNGSNIFGTFCDKDTDVGTVLVETDDGYNYYLKNASQSLHLTKRQHTVSFDKNNGDEVQVKQIVDFGNSTVAISKPVNSGKRFVGWYENLSDLLAYDFSTPIVKNLVLTAKWGDKFLGTNATAPTLSGVYGTKVKDLTLNSESAKIMYEGSEVAGSWSLTDTNQEDIPSADTVSSYALTFTPTDTENYATLRVNVIPTIAKKPVQITKAPVLTGTYGTKVASLEISGGAAETLAGKWSFTDTAKSDIPSVGTTKSYKVSFTPNDTKNYSIPEATDASVIIKKKDISIVIKNVEVTEGSIAESLSYDISDDALVAGDTKDDLNIVLKTDATKTSKPGTYRVYMESSNSANYNVSVANEGVYTVEAPMPTPTPTVKPTEIPTEVPTKAPTEVPTATPTVTPTKAPTATPTVMPTEAPTATSTVTPTKAPTQVPTAMPTKAPTQVPTAMPTKAPTQIPTVTPTETPTGAPTAASTETTTKAPTEAPTATTKEAPTVTPPTTLVPSSVSSPAKFASSANDAASDSAKTGDTSNVCLWIMLFGVCGAVLVAVVRKKQFSDK